MLRPFAITFTVRGPLFESSTTRTIQRMGETIDLVEGAVRAELREAYPSFTGESRARILEIVALNPTTEG